SKLVYVPDADFNGTVSFGYKVQDSGPDGANVSEEATLQVNVAAVSDAPVASGDMVEVEEDGEYTFQASDFGFTDVDGDDLAAVIITSLPGNGRLVYD